MDKKENPDFRFIAENEFSTLPARERSAYLVRAAKQLELRQVEIRQLLQKIAETQRKFDLANRGGITAASE